VHEVIQAHRRYLVELMQQWTRIKEDDAGGDLNMLSWRSTPSCSGSTRSSGGSTPPTARVKRTRPPAALSSRPERRCRSSDGT
jgi:hypothetical protein